MSSRDRDTKSLQDKLKVFFKKVPSASQPARNELVVTPELERELSADTPLHRRLRALREVSERALHVRVQEGGVEKIWRCTRDLLEGGMEARHGALGALRQLTEGQADQLQVMRTVLFRFLQESHGAHASEDDTLRFRLLHALTNTGKDINCIEEQIGPFLLEWLAQLESATLVVELLQLIINVVKFNAAYLDEHVVHGIVKAACQLCVYCAEGGVVAVCLALLEAVVSYSLLPRAALRDLVAALCRTVNMDNYCQTSWKLMRYVVGGDIGHAALQELVEILRSAGSVGAVGGGAGGGGEADAGLVRGAVFYINMALWGPRRVPTLKVSFLAVLPAFLKALEWNAPVVTYEVICGVSSAVTRSPQELCEPAWDILLHILRQALIHDKSYDPPNEMINSKLHLVLTTLEELVDMEGGLGPDPDALLDLIDSAGHDRPEASTMRLVTGRAGALSPSSSEWVGAALALADKYLRHEPRIAVRTHTLEQLMAFIHRNRYVYGSELVELVGVPVLGACAGDADCTVRSCAARALTSLAALDACTDLIDLLEKILNRPFEMYVSDVPVPADADITDLRQSVTGLLHLLHEKLLASPAAIPLRCFLVLLDHLDHHYKRPALFQHHPELRLKILEMLFGLRANGFNCVGFCYDGSGTAVTGAASLRMRPLCSPFLLAEPPLVRGQQASPPRELPPGSCIVPVGRVARVVAGSLAREAQWTVLGGVLRALPPLLQTRALAVGRRAQDLDLLASTLCSMISDRSLCFPECVRVSGGQKLLLSEFHGATLPALAAMAPYHSYLEPQTQQRIVRCLLKYGMVLRSPQPYINALTIFTLETRDTMVKMLPEVLLDLSKISDTQAIASPMLEFLSTLTRLPKVFASFVEDQYMSVFAILLPYTNPSRYNHYVVSLAHHVIAAWFLKCRLSYRRNFVRFIIHGLHNYIIMPFEEQLHSRTNNYQQGAANEDSSNRQRSSSLGSRAVPRSAGLTRGGSASAAFHVELTETCVDLLARYTTTPCSSKPTRSETAQFLFEGGQSMTWLVGHKLVTITTSGCQQNSLKQGLCDRCATLCKQHAESITSPLPPLHTPAPTTHTMPTTADTDAQPQMEQPLSNIQVQVNDGESEPTTQHNLPNQPEVKRYSKWSLQHSNSTETSSSISISDLHPGSGHTTRQNSSENSKATDPLVEILNQFTQRFERISKEVDSEEASWWRSNTAASTDSCACWCAQWASLHVRAPTGDVCWLLRLQNQMNWDYLLESPLQDVAALLNPAAASPPSPSPSPSHTHTPGPPTSPGHTPASSGLGDSRHTSETSLRSRSGSASSHRQSRTPAATDMQDLHKSSSDSVVTGDKRSQLVASQCTMSSQQLRMSTQPINIPGSPQRQGSIVPTHDVEDMLLILPEGKSRHPVRRSNSSPEMSSSWKVTPRDSELPLDPEEMILLPSCEPTSQAGAGAGAGNGTTSTAASQSLHGKKPAKKSDMRVSCEAIPEEISGTSPHTHTHTHTHTHLCTFYSDPGASGAGEGGLTAASSVTATAAVAAHNKHHLLQKTASDGTVPASAEAGVGTGTGTGTGTAGRERDDLPPLARSKRSNTISVMSPTRRHRPSNHSHTASSGGGGGAGGASGGGGGGGGGAVGGGGGGVTPSFVFLQLYHNMSTYPITPPVPGEAQSILNPLAERPLRVSGVQHERTIKNLDLLPPVETYKVGVLYVAPGQQDNESAILRNEYGSVRYAEFLRQLGSLVPLGGGGGGPHGSLVPLGGGGGGLLGGEPLFLNLETGGKDGRYTYVWHDDVMQVQFHVATAMPNLDSDPNCNEKRKYIGNDYVSIVYNDSGADFHMHTIKGQLNFCLVLVEPMSHGMTCVRMKSKDERILREFLPHVCPAVVSDCNAALLARQLALHCALAAHIAQSLALGGAPYASNSLERLRAIKRLRRRVEGERVAAERAPAYTAPDRHQLHQRVAIDDFNDYT